MVLEPAPTGRQQRSSAHTMVPAASISHNMSPCETSIQRPRGQQPAPATPNAMLVTAAVFRRRLHHDLAHGHVPAARLSPVPGAAGRCHEPAPTQVAAVPVPDGQLLRLS